MNFILGIDVGGSGIKGAPVDLEAGDFAAEMQQLQLDVAAMPALQPAAAPTRADEAGTAGGAVLIVAGTGGPDAVRQLLGGLPNGFPRPVLLRQHIDGEQYDKLVRQMRRATGMPVLLAQAGDPLVAGSVHVLPPGLDVHAGPNGLDFIAVDGEPRFTALKPSESALLLLSGAAPAMVDLAMSMRWAGALVFGQSAENCFDASASNALVARGGEATNLVAMSRKLLERWPA